ncbi:similar to Saccharomyces cerevisiae YDR320C SWA2 Auxilin-like protein involved in vesicular transport [Maudiozyma barnettii]|uniref:Similar to Saccharomyces cerevisiae YDR320C SWA2 Auxilin-like protein involved in vesicular transport n=1 Tax=Maudiozyma barnettii TaxID=61262 RepID=A0A8H2VDX6_9SACH|nr:Swa2p [Kazachstania barnettii]CAB4253804.1 similar to Saccharomyces cerevisiae YDR320C SWA2 Auxilin-like protein involved in vesicular transport [Kazachstania barnettii]CAD1781553.1 similar to Saccharomyces cerevisiae YDR320C SWA2 Auxilin-like protein involved in vesicular transport [Kazachstania barnettii]
MADPFANLLTSLKEEKKTNKNEVGNQVTNTLNADLNNNDLLQSNSKPLVVPSHEINMNDSIHNDLDDLFGFSSQSNTPAPIPQRQPVNGSTANNDDDDFMSVFDNFDSKEQSTQQYISENPLPSSSNENVSVVVDEIKDMEVAQLMSLGMSIDKANKYYNKGVLYDDIIKNRKLKQMQERRQENDRVGTTFFSDSNTNKKNISSSIFSVATDFLNKGKDLVDQLTAYPDEEANRLYKYNGNDSNSAGNIYDERSRFKPSMNKAMLLDDETNPFDINNYEAKLETQPSRTSNTLVFKVPTNVTESSTQVPDSIEGDLLDDFNENVIISEPMVKLPAHSPSREYSYTKSEQPVQSTLLDFDSDSGNNTSNTTGSRNSTLPIVHISTMELSGYNEFNLNAKELFGNGNYSSAFEEYEKSLNTLPSLHPLRIVALSNMIISQMKIGDYSKCIENAKLSLNMFPSDKVQWNNTIQNSNPPKTYKELWSKIISRQAEAYEHQENFEAALDALQLLLQNGIHDPKIMSAKRRCQKVLNPEAFVSKPKINSSTPAPKPMDKRETKRNIETEPKINKNVEEIKEQHNKEEEISKQKSALYDIVFDKVESWKNNKTDDIRFLLSNLSTIITWTEWKPVSTADLVIPKKVKITYLKAITKLHPDKLSSDLSLQNRMIAENVFSVLSVAWEKFKEENNMT